MGARAAHPLFRRPLWNWNLENELRVLFHVSSMKVGEGENGTRWHSRGYLPHYEGGNIPQFITYRLADSLPQSVLKNIEAELEQLPDEQRLLERYRRCEEYLDQGIGKCWLARVEIAAIVQENLLFFENKRYSLHSWYIMPNHVHALITPNEEWELEVILHGWKSFTAKAAN